VKDLNHISLRRYCDVLGVDGGAFLVPFEGRNLRVIASNGLGWDHLSVSLSNRTPNWREMECVKRMFFKDDEWAFQLHAPPSAHINIHPYVLHIWRPQHLPIPTPDNGMV
jgi:hypothetical protein